MVNRTSPTTMDVSWRPLTLSEARGAVTFYSIAYTPTPNSRRRQTSESTLAVNASNDSSSISIPDLNRTLAYSVTVSASTIAGTGPAGSSETIAEIFPTQPPPKGITYWRHHSPPTYTPCPMELSIG